MAKGKKTDKRSRIIGAKKLFGDITSGKAFNGMLWNVYHHKADGKLLLAPQGGCTPSDIVELPLTSDQVAKIIKVSNGKNFATSKERAVYLAALYATQEILKKQNKNKPGRKFAALSATKKTVSKPANAVQIKPVTAIKPVETIAAKRSPKSATLLNPTKAATTQPAAEIELTKTTAIQPVIELKPAKAVTAKPGPKLTKAIKTTKSSKIKAAVIPASSLEIVRPYPVTNAIMNALSAPPDVNRPDTLEIAIAITRGILDALEKLQGER
ncbi:MAG: hypothetical protein HQM09_12685 [Candidatus Riflebacteria bacterium]|nr:hypothetical protein [Candidatus Riflebacteria bacterium]